MSHLSRIDSVGRTRLRLVSQGAKQLREPCFTRCSWALSPRELKPPGGRVPARRPRGRVSPHASLNPERRVPARAPQAPACPRTRALFAADTPRFAEPLSSLCRPARRAARRTVLLAAPCHRGHRTVRRSARYRGAFAHPTRWHSVSARSEPAQRAITPQQWNRHAITPQQRSQRVETPQQRHHGPPADAYEPLAKRTSQALRPDPGC